MHALIISALPVTLLALVHILVGRIRILDPGEDSPWLSAAAGTAIAYVFVYLLPKLGGLGVDLDAGLDGPVYKYLRHHAYVIALAGFTFYFWIMWANEDAGPGGNEAGSRTWVLVLKVLGLSAYCMQVGYLLADMQRPGPVPMVIATAVLALHFLGLDNHFRRHHRQLYDDVVRWVFTVTTLAGWLVGVLTQVHPVTVGLWSAFVGGGIIVTAMREELPSEGETQFMPFLLAVVITTASLVVVEHMPKF